MPPEFRPGLQEVYGPWLKRLRAGWASFKESAQKQWGVCKAQFRDFMASRQQQPQNDFYPEPPAQTQRQQTHGRFQRPEFIRPEPFSRRASKRDDEEPFFSPEHSSAPLGDKERLEALRSDLSRSRWQRLKAKWREMRDEPWFAREKPVHGRQTSHFRPQSGAPAEGWLARFKREYREIMDEPWFAWNPPAKPNPVAQQAYAGEMDGPIYQQASRPRARRRRSSQDWRRRLDYLEREYRRSNWRPASQRGYRRRPAYAQPVYDYPPAGYHYQPQASPPPVPPPPVPPNHAAAAFAGAGAATAAGLCNDDQVYRDGASAQPQKRGWGWGRSTPKPPKARKPKRYILRRMMRAVKAEVRNTFSVGFSFAREAAIWGGIALAGIVGIQVAKADANILSLDNAQRLTDKMTKPQNDPDQTPTRRGATKKKSVQVPKITQIQDSGERTPATTRVAADERPSVHILEVGGKSSERRALIIDRNGAKLVRI